MQNGVILAVVAVLSAFTLAAGGSAAFIVAISVTHADAGVAVDADIVCIVQVQHRGRAGRGERRVEDVIRSEQQRVLREIEGIAVSGWMDSGVADV